MTTAVHFEDADASALSYTGINQKDQERDDPRKVKEVRAARRVLVTLFMVATWLVVFPAPSASAGAELDVGMPIDIGQHRCSLGFFGFNSRGDRLAVTAGHCSDQRPNEPVHADNGVQIGEVVAWRQDTKDGDGKLVGPRGYTVFLVYKRFSLDPFFTDVSASLKNGNYVSKFGERTGKTNGRVTGFATVPNRPDLDLINSNMVQLPGDSGCPWYIDGPAIVGIASSGDQETDGGDAGSQAQPIQAIIDMIRMNSTAWDDDFKVWTKN
jgi:hypothetical protein